MRIAALCSLALGLLTVSLAAQAQDLAVERLGTYATGLFDEGAAEAAVYHAPSQRLFVLDAAANALVALDASDVSAPVEAFTVDLSSYGAAATNIAISTVFYDDIQNVRQEDTIIAVAFEADPKTDPGTVALFNPDGTVRQQRDANEQLTDTLPVGPTPSALAFSPYGGFLVVTNEGEPNADYSIDPEGTVSVISFAVPVSGGDWRQAVDITTVDFRAFNLGAARADEITNDPSIRIFGPDATVAQDLEPESVAISPDRTTVYVSLQENNALAILDFSFGTFEIHSIVGLGFKDHNVTGQGLDPSDRDDGIAIAPHPVFGMYQPDGLAAADISGTTYLFAANSGDARETDAFAEEARIKSLTLDATAFPDAAALQADDVIGRLNVTTALGDPDDDGDYDALYAFGARSISIHSADGTRIWDSGDGIERQLEALIDAGLLSEAAFGSDNDDNDSFDNRSDAKGPEPDQVTTGVVNGVPYAFVGLERTSGVLAYDVSTPAAPVYAGWIANRDYSVDAQLPDGSANPDAGDLGPEDITFIPSDASPTQTALLVVSNAVSGTVTLYALGTPDISSEALPEARWVRLHGATPNPAQTPQIVFDLQTPAQVRVVVFDALGREVASSEERMPAGTDLRLAPDVRGLAAGTYVYALEATAGTETVRRTGRFVLAR